MKQEDVELFCKNRNVKYISHKTHEDGISLLITIEREMRVTPHEIEPYINQQKLKEAKK